MVQWSGLKQWFEFKSEFSLNKNSHFYWIQLNNAIPKAWKENLYKEDKNYHELTFSGHHLIKKYQIYSLSVTVKSCTLYKSL